MKHKLIAAGSFILALSFIVPVLAQTTTGTVTMHGSDGTMMPSSVMMMHPPKPMVLTVSTSGHGLLRGVVESVGTSSLTVAAWGGTWTVTVPVGTIVSPSSDLSKVAVGDFVGATGMVSENAPILVADYVRDWTMKDAMMH